MERVAVPSSLTNYGERLPLFYVRDLTEKFVSALAMFRERQRPPVELLVEIKQKIFGLPSIGSKFKRTTWNPWRADDAEFRSKQT